MSKKLLLFDPRTGERKLTDLHTIAGITGRTVNSMRTSIGRKIKTLNCYLLEEDTPLSILRQLLSMEVIYDEVWRDIPNSRWQVSSYGRYRSGLRCQDRIVYRVPYPGINSTSCMVGIRINGEKHQLRAHEKVVELFIGEVPKGYVVYHKDGNKANNRVENLGFIKRNKLMQRQATTVRAVEVQQLDMETGEVIAEYSTLIAAARANYTQTKSIRDAAKNNRASIGFRWVIEQEKSLPAAATTSKRLTK